MKRIHEAYSGHPSGMTTKEIMDKICCFIIDDRRVTLCDIAKVIHITTEPVSNKYFARKLQLQNLCA